MLLSRDLACPRDSEPVSHADSRATRETSSSLPTIGMRMRELTRRFESGRTGDPDACELGTGLDETDRHPARLSQRSAPVNSHRRLYSGTFGSALEV